MVMTDFATSVAIEDIRQAICVAADKISSPHAIMRPRVFPDGNMWCALYGDDLQMGVAGFGATPAAACADFDKNWNTQRALIEKENGDGV
jgi:hypothetical protein